MLKEQHKQIYENIPDDVLVYEIAGPLFFGAAEKAVESLTAISDSCKRVVFLMNQVPMMDMTGLAAFDSALKKLHANKKTVLIVGAKKQPKELLRKLELVHSKKVLFSDTLHQALTPRD